MNQVMGKRKRDDDSGKYVEKYPVEDVLAAIRDISNRAATIEISDRIGSTRQGAFAKLQKLEEEGRVESQDVGGVRLWSVVEEDEEE